LEGLIQVCPQVGGEDREAVEGFDALQEICDLDIGISIAGVGDLGSLAEESIGLVEE